MKGSQNISPPRWPFKLLQRLVRESYLEEIEGDMEERFYDNIEKYNIKKARQLYVLDSFKLLRPGLARKLGGDVRLNQYGMLLNHFKFTFRLFAKNKFYTSLNLTGLVLGITCGLIGILYLQNEFTYDLHHTQHEKIFRLTNRIQMTGFDVSYAKTAQELPPLIKENLPELISYVRFVPFDEEEQTVTVIYEPGEGFRKQFYEERLMRADSNVFSFFTHEFVFGDPATCLLEPNKMVLTESMARKYFGNDPPMGKLITVKSIKEENFVVSGVIKDLPDNSHLKYDFLVSGIPSRPWVPYAGFGHTIWNPSSYSYLIFPESYDASDFADEFRPIFKQHFTSTAMELGGIYTPTLEPLADVHFKSTTQFDEPQGNLSFVYIFGCVVSLVVLMVCINYVNLSTAKSLSRTREMGVRKVLGTTRRALLYSVLIETLVLVIFAYLISLLCAYLIIHASPLNDLIGKELTFNFFQNSTLMLGSVGVVLLVSLLSGIYPGLYIPSYSTVDSLKGNIKMQGSSSFFRRGLTTLQFTISLLVIISTVVMGRQLKYMQNKDLGYRKENLLLLRIPDKLSRDMLQTSISEFTQTPDILSATYATTFPGSGSENTSVFKIEKDGEYLQKELRQNFVGDNYLETMEMELLEGRGFFTDSEEDILNSFIANEAMIKAMGWTDSPIGKTVKRWDGKKLGQVIGVVKDYNFYSLHNQIDPMFIRLYKEPDEDESAGYFHIRLSGKNLSETLVTIEEKWKHLFDGQIFEFEFLDQKIDNQYKADKRQNEMFAVLSSISIIIALLGLIGLALYSATQKTKEIGIRKVLGASISNILTLLSKEYLWLTILACVIAMPLSYLFIQEWLNSFAFRTSIYWWHFAVPSILMLVLIFVIVSSQSMKVARSNPIDSLKDE
ncbi:MAG: FtsX-like permease family protein [Cyclobacteriaceae bacterium]